MEMICQVCMHNCRLKPGQTGLCGARKRVGDEIRCENYGKLSAVALDPIEKKPLRMFEPGSMVLSVGSFGCNLKCPFCQNHEISMMRADTKQPGDRQRTIATLSAQELVKKACMYRPQGNIGVAYTYNEPLVGWEYVRDTAKLVKQAGMKNILVTNGTASLAVLEELLPYIDAMNIDLKGFQSSYYRKLGGDLQTVKEFITRAVVGCHVELTTLVVPGETDRIEDMEAQAQWIASLPHAGGKSGGLGQVPLHVTRFFPRYRMADRRATPVQTVYRLAETAGKYLEHVFVGNC